MQARSQHQLHLKPPYTVTFSSKQRPKITIRNKQRNIQLTITLNDIADLQFTTSQSPMFSFLSLLSKSYDAYGVIGVHTFHDIPFLILITSVSSVCSIDNTPIYKVTDIKCLPLQRVPATATAIVDYYIANYRKVVIDNFYFAYQYNLGAAYAQQDAVAADDHDVFVINKHQLDNCRDGFNLSLSKVKTRTSNINSAMSANNTFDGNHSFMSTLTSATTALSTSSTTFKSFFTYCICGYVSSIHMKLLKQDITCTVIQRRSNDNTPINLTNYEVIVKCNSSTFSKEYFSFSNAHVADSANQQHVHTALTTAFSFTSSAALMIVNTFYKDTAHLQDDVCCTLQGVFDDARVLCCVFDSVSSHHSKVSDNAKQHQIELFRLNKQIEQMCIKHRHVMTNSNNVLVVSCTANDDDASLKVIERVSYDMVMQFLGENDVFAGKTSEIFGTLLSYVNVDDSDYLYGVSEYESEDMSLVKNGFNSMAWNGSLFRGNYDVIANSVKYEDSSEKKESMESTTGMNSATRKSQPMNNNNSAYDIYLHGEHFNKSYDDIFAELTQRNAQFRYELFKLTNNNNGADTSAKRALLPLPLSLPLPRQLSNNMNSINSNVCLDSITTYLATWNVNAFDTTSPQNVSFLNLRELFFPHKHSFQMEARPDIIVVSLQEIVELSTKNILLQDSNKPSVEFWVNQLWECVGKDAYIKLEQNELVGIMLVTFIKVNLFAYVTHCRAFTKKTGVSGLFGNKGVCVHSFKLFGRNFAFAGVHYACGVEKNAKRVGELRTTLDVALGKDELFRQSDVWFVCGDLNFRIELDKERCMDSINQRDANALREHDQCRNVMKRLYNDEICEDVVRFMPTFKFVKGQNEYDLSKRVPSWCDRIVYKNTHLIKNVFYDVAQIYLSDHIPVVGLYKVNVDMISSDDCI